MRAVLLLASAPQAAPVAALGAALLLLLLPTRAGSVANGAPLVAALAVLALAIMGQGHAASFRTDLPSTGFAVAVACLGVASAALPFRSALPSVRRVLSRACPVAQTGFALLAVRLADPFLATASLFLAAALAACLGSLAQGPFPARAGFRLLAADMLAAAFAIVSLLLGETGATPLLLGVGLLVFAAVWPFGALARAAAALAPATCLPPILLVTPVAAFSLLLSLLPALSHGAFGPLVRPILFLLGVGGLLDAGWRGAADRKAANAAAFLLSLALAAASLGGRTGLLAALLALALCVLVVPALLAAPWSAAVRVAAAALPPFGAGLPLALALDRAAAIAPSCALLLGAAALPAMTRLLRPASPDGDAERWEGAPVALIALLAALALGFAIPDRLDDALLASADLLRDGR